MKVLRTKRAGAKLWIESIAKQDEIDLGLKRIVQRAEIGCQKLYCRIFCR
jgi:hypothetical protein